jgi:EmrB/QacA subfamily drug resistance transporter
MGSSINDIILAAAFVPHAIALSMLSQSRILPLVFASALFMENMDSTVIATSLPAIAEDLGTSPVALKLAFTTYLLSLTVFLPISSWVADRFGASTVFRVAVAIFTLSSLACGFAHSLESLVVARAFQGLGGAMMVPVGRIIMLRTVPKSEYVNAMAWLTVPALIGPLLGPPIGGFITTYFHWRWIFWINIPFGILSMALATALMPNLRDENVAPLDVRGFFLSGLGLSLSVFGLTELGQGMLAWWQVLAMTAAGFALMLVYVRHAKRLDSPILDLKMLKVQTLRVSIVGGLFFRISAGAIPFLLPLMLQVGFGFTPFQSGTITCASALGALVMKFLAAQSLKRWGYRNLLMLNGIGASIFIALNGLFTPATPFWMMAGLLLAAGLLRSLQYTSLNSIAYADVTSEEVGRANGLYTVAQQLSQALGVAVAALTLEFSQYLHEGTSIARADFQVAFVVIAIICSISTFFFARLPKTAGENLSGHQA